MGGDVIGLTHQRLVRGLVGDDPAVGQVPPLHAFMSHADIGRVGQVLVGPLPVPHLVPGIAGVLQDRGHRAKRPPGARAVRVPARVGRRRARDACLVQNAGDPGHRVPGEALGEDPPHHMGGFGVGFEAVGAAAPGGVSLVRVRPGITEPVPVRRTPAQVPALLPGLDRHRRPHPDTRPGHLPLRRQPQHRHRLLVMLRDEIDPPAASGIHSCTP